MAEVLRERGKIGAAEVWPVNVVPRFAGDAAFVDCCLGPMNGCGSSPQFPSLSDVRRRERTVGDGVGV